MQRNIIFFIVFFQIFNLINCSEKTFSPKKRPFLSPLILQIRDDSFSSFAGQTPGGISDAGSSLIPSPEDQRIMLTQEMNDLIVTPQKVYELGQRLNQFRNQQSEQGAELLERFHNLVGSKLRIFFKDVKGEFDGKSYNLFLEQCLPRLGEDKQTTPCSSPMTLLLQQKLPFAKEDEI